MAGAPTGLRWQCQNCGLPPIRSGFFHVALKPAFGDTALLTGIWRILSRYSSFSGAKSSIGFWPLFSQLSIRSNALAQARHIATTSASRIPSRERYPFLGQGAEEWIIVPVDQVNMGGLL